MKSKLLNDSVHQPGFTNKSVSRTLGDLMRGLVSPLYIGWNPGNVVTNAVNGLLNTFTDSGDVLTRKGLWAQSEIDDMHEAWFGTHRSEHPPVGERP